MLGGAAGSLEMGYEMGRSCAQAMSEEQLAAFIAKLKADAGLQEKLKGAGDLNTVLAIAKEAGFDVTKADWLRHQGTQVSELSDEELEEAVGGICLASINEITKCVLLVTTGKLCDDYGL